MAKETFIESVLVMSKNRIYICHTFYHVYIACLKELVTYKNDSGNAAICLSTLSNDFKNLNKRLEKSGLFNEVFIYDEKPEEYFDELKKYHTDRGNLILNLFQRIKYTKLFGKLEAPFIPTNLKNYKDIFVFCDSDPIGYYLNYAKLSYHALEDGLNCIQYYDTARYDNRGHFGLKAFLSKLGLIFIQNGYGRYCIDMEVNDISVLTYPCKKYIEQSREELVNALSGDDKSTLCSIFIENMDALRERLNASAGTKMLLLSEPLCDLETRKRIFTDIIDEYGTIDGKKALILIKPHPRDTLDYKKEFSEHVVLDAFFPMEILNFVEGLEFDRVASVFTVPNSIKFAKEIIFLGEDFMDKYEAPEIHRQNEQI